MVHVRLNEKETNPNPHVNFITALKAEPREQEDARQVLRALAAQVRPVMKKYGFAVNSFEEYEYNHVFAGRNWNNGETVELVLRRLDGTFYPTYWLMGTLCHEHMNHGPAFQALWTRLRAEVRQLQDRGYYGDGYWSSGTRLLDSARIGGEGIEAGDFPEYMCGGAQSRTRPTATRRRRGPQGKRREVVPSLHTGAQTAKKRKAGGRVTSKYAFTGEGATLGDDGKGTGFGKKAASKRAREERAIATERRLLALQGGSEDSKGSASKAPHSSVEENSDDDEVEFVSETDAERRQTLLDSEKDADLQENLGSGKSWKLFKDDFNFQGGPEASGSRSTLRSADIIDISSDEDDAPACDVPVASGSTFTTGSVKTPNASGKGKEKESPSSGDVDLKTTSMGKQKQGLGRMVQTEIDLRTKESLGMAPVKGKGRTLGSKPSTNNSIPQKANEESLPLPPSQGVWRCLVCTLENEPGYLSCSACATPRGQRVWPQST